MNNKIKVSAPQENPHICYISKEYADKVKDIKAATGLSLYRLICTCSGYSLNSKNKIKKFKEKVKKQGFKNIGDWAESLIDLLHGSVENISVIDLSSISISKKKED